MSPHLTFVLWILAGVLAGGVIRVGNVRLARWESLTPGRRWWQVWGPLIVTGALFGLFAWTLGPSRLLLIQSLWIVVLVQVMFFDLEHHLILDRVLAPAAVLAVALSFFTPYLGWKNALASGLVTGLVFLAIAVLGAVVFKAEAMGFGDVKFSVLMGLIVGFPAILLAVLSGVIVAGVLAILLVVLRIRSMQDSIAYGPFLAMGALLALYRLAAAGA